MIILLNGPPYSGKDTAAKFIQEFIDAQHYKNSKPLKAGIKAIFNITSEAAKWLEEHKDQHTPLLRDKSYREAQIELFRHLESCYGPAILGQTGAYYIKNNSMRKHAVISDCGRSKEAQEYTNSFGYSQVGLIKLSRDGCSFEDDIREYVDAKCRFIEEINNKYDLELFEQQIRRVLVKWKLVKDV